MRSFCLAKKRFASTMLDNNGSIFYCDVCDTIFEILRFDFEVFIWRAGHAFVLEQFKYSRFWYVICIHKFEEMFKPSFYSTNFLK